MIRNVEALQERLRAYAMSLPEAWEDHPWGETVAKVRKKVFVFGLSDEMKESPHEYPPGISVKLGPSLAAVSKRSFASPTGYGLGKSGWRSIRFDLKESPTEAELQAWIRESYCLVAPKTLARQVDPAAMPKKKARKKRQA